MNNASRGLQFDRRLLRRRGWVDPEELRRYLESLPDVSDKIRRPEEKEGAPRGGSPPGENAGSQGPGTGPTTAGEPPTGA